MLCMSIFINVWIIVAAALLLSKTGEGKADLPLVAWGMDRNNKLTSRDYADAISYLSGKNITEIISTDNAFVVRVASKSEESDLIVNRLKDAPYIDAQTKHFALADRSMGNYVVWGSSSDGGEIPAEKLEILNSYGPGLGNLPTTYPQMFHVFSANDVCGLKDAFVAIRNNKLVCWGNPTTCTNSEAIFGGNNNLKVVKVYCPAGGRVAIVLLNGNIPIYEIRIAVFGDPNAGGKFPTDTDFHDAIKQITSTGVNQVVANTGAVAILLQGGRVLAWGDPKVGGVIPTSVDGLFNSELFANDIGFAAIKTTRKVVSWGNSNVFSIPKRIREDGEAHVKTILTSANCFAAILEDGGVATWGTGDQLFCNEEGASNSDRFVSYRSVKDHLTSGVRKLVLNDNAFAAIKSDGTLITWGDKEKGGSKLPPAGFEKYWQANDLIWPIPDTLVATCCAFGFIRQDGRPVAWGSEIYGGWLDKNNGIKKAIRMAASNESMGIMDGNNGIFQWNGDTIGHVTIDSQFEGLQIPFPPKLLVRTHRGLMAILGTDCTYTPWDKWSDCTKLCGGGLTFRTRRIISYATNGYCSDSRYEEKTCNDQTCTVTKGPAKLSDIDTGKTIAVASGGLLVVGVAALGVWACCKRPQRAEYM